MPIPPTCQPLADDLEKIGAEIADLQERLENAKGSAKGPIAAKVAAKQRAFSAKRAALEQCVFQNTPPAYCNDVVVIDIPGGTVLPYHGNMWELVPPSTQMLLESRDEQAGVICFAHGGTPDTPGQSIGISMQDALGSPFTGPMFRSGPLPSLPGGAANDPAGLIQIVVPPPPPAITVATLDAALPAVGTVLSTSPSVTISAPPPSITLAPGSATLTVNGTVAIPLLFTTLTVPFTFAVTLAIAPSFNMNDVTEVCVVTPLGSGTLTTTTGGPVGLLFGSVGAAFAPVLSLMVAKPIQGTLNAAILATVASSFTSGVIPPGVVVSMRRVVITASGVAFLPALGKFGGFPFP